MKERPNIVVFMTDQQSHIATEKAITPNLDKFLARSVKFTEAYCVAPHCCPSRASFFSGLMPSQHGVWNNVEVDNSLSHDLFENVTLFPSILAQNGYRTIFSGKWHVSGIKGPLEHGFEKVLCENSTNSGRGEYQHIARANDWENLYKNTDIICGANEDKNDGQIVKEGYAKVTQYAVDENPFGDSTAVKLACDEIQNYDGKEPLFMFVGPIGPHDPYHVPQKYLDLYQDMDINLPANFEDDMIDKPNLYRRTKDQYPLTKEEHIESLRHYLAFISYEDDLFGQLLDTLDAKGELDDTVIIYTTDHGDYAGAHGLWAKGLPCFKEAYNIVAAIGGNGIINKSTDEFISLIDFAPTILELAGVKNPLIMSGHSLAPILYGKEQKKRRSEIYTQTNGNEIYGIQRAVFNRKYKFVYNSFDYDELYDLENDPFELKNIATDPKNKEIIKDMYCKMWQFAYETNDNCTCGYIMTRLATYGPGIIFNNK